MKHKLLLVLLTALIPCLFMQGCISNFEEDNTELSEEDRVAEMFREAGFKVEKLSSKPVNPPMTEKEASLFLAAYKNRERSGKLNVILKKRIFQEQELFTRKSSILHIGQLIQFETLRLNAGKILQDIGNPIM